MIERLTPPGAPAPKGPYSPAVRAGGFIFLSGQVPPEKGDIRHETRQVLSNIRRILESIGSSMADVVRVGVYLANGADFGAMNEVYADFFGENKPARTTVVCGFVADIKIEVDCVAYRPE